MHKRVTILAVTMLMVGVSGCGSSKGEVSIPNDASLVASSSSESAVDRSESISFASGAVVPAALVDMRPVVVVSEPFDAWQGCQGLYSSQNTNLEVVSLPQPSINSGSVQFSSASAPPAAGNGGFSGVSPNDAPFERELPQTPDISSDATEFYFSYDESESTASRDLSLQAILANQLPDSIWGRPYEFLNAERFGHYEPVPLGPFSVSMGLLKTENGAIPVGPAYETDLYSLGVNLSGPELTKEARRNVVLTLLVDISGSMGTGYGGFQRIVPATLLDVTQHAMYKLLPSLKNGDVVNLVTFDTNAEIVLSEWVYEDGDCGLVDAVAGLYTRGSTNLEQGVEFAYQIAQQTYDADKANRVIMLTDAYANTGEVSPNVIAEHTVINGLEGILFSGVGIGRSFNDRFLNELTDIGKGTYSAMVSPNDAERIMTESFTRFIDYAYSNVRFKVEYPQSLDQLESAAEDISVTASEVSTVNFSYNSDQFFLESFHGSAEPEDLITLSVTYDDAEGAAQEASVTMSVAELMGLGEEQIISAIAVVKLAQLIGGELSCSDVLQSALFDVSQEGLSASTGIYNSYTGFIEQMCEGMNRGPELIVD